MAKTNILHQGCSGPQQGPSAAPRPPPFIFRLFLFFMFPCLRISNQLLINWYCSWIVSQQVNVEKLAVSQQTYSQLNVVRSLIHLSCLNIYTVVILIVTQSLAIKCQPHTLVHQVTGVKMHSPSVLVCDGGYTVTILSVLSLISTVQLGAVMWCGG